MKARRFLELGRRDSLEVLKALGLVAVIALVVAGCRGSNPQASGSGERPPSPAPSSSTSPIESRPSGSTAPPAKSAGVAGPSSSRAALDPVASARTLATQSCQIWRSGEMQNAAQGSALLHLAARTATRASLLDGRWKLLSKEMTYVSSLPLTGNTPAAVARSRADLKHMRSTCASLGVLIEGT